MWWRAGWRLAWILAPPDFEIGRSSEAFLIPEQECEKWPAPGSEDTELGVLMEPEVRHGAAELAYRRQGQICVSASDASEVKFSCSRCGTVSANASTTRIICSLEIPLGTQARLCA
jgi:hypothetical protein